MRDRATTPAVYTFHLTRPGVLVALLGIVAIVLGFMAPASAGDNQGGGVDPEAKPWICHPVGGAGELGYGWNLIDPNHESAHFDDEGLPKHEAEGRVDTYAMWNGSDWVCPGAPTTEPTSPTTEPPTTTTTEPTTEPPTEPPTTTTTEPTTEPPTTTTTEPGTQPPTTDTPSTGATSPSSTSKPVVPVEEPPDEAATVAPTTPVQDEPSAEAPEVGAIEENAVPQAQTDGADLVQGAGWTALQSTLVGAGLLLLAAGGLLSVRRERVSG